MSPLWIKLLLHIYSNVNDYRDEVPCQHATSPAVAQGFDWLAANGFIKHKFTGAEWREIAERPRPSQFAITDKGECYVTALCSLPYPEQQWVMPQRPDDR